MPIEQDSPLKSFESHATVPSGVFLGRILRWVLGLVLAILALLLACFVGVSIALVAAADYFEGADAGEVRGG